MEQSSISQLQSNLMQVLSGSSDNKVRAEIATKVTKDAQNSQEQMIQTLIVNAPQPTTPKSMNSTFEYKV